MILAALVVAPEAFAAGQVGTYVVRGVHNRADRTAIARTGAGIDEVRRKSVIVRATRRERKAIARRGFRIRRLARAADFPPADSPYHNYTEMVAEMNAVANARPASVHLFSIGSSVEGRSLIGARISNDAADRTDEPGVLLVAQHHAREHLSVEVALSLLHQFAESTDQTVRALVESRQIYIVPSLNPDGGEYDIATGSYRFWRKNRQPTPGSTQIGTDPNRNYGYRWGCCGGSSGNPASETFRGPSPFSTPEVAALRGFVEAHPNLRTAISYHSYGDLVLYPYGYTFEDVPADMTRVDRDTFAAMAQEMGRTTGYRPQQASDLYITDGDFTDWMYGVRGVYAFTIELGGSGFYPGAGIIPSETAKNQAAAIYVAQLADCPTRVITVTCGGSGPGPVPPAAPPYPDPPAPVATPRPAGPGRGKTVNGTSRSETLVGTPFADVINCGAGNDRVRAGSGNDVINCGAGNDLVDAGSGNDRIGAGTGEDRLLGKQGSDRLSGAPGNDRLFGDEGADLLLGGRGDDRLSGGEGNDRLFGNAGRDLLFREGRDRLSGGSGRDRTIG